jgi:4'-phosphopantetheinyl transferase
MLDVFILENRNSLEKIYYDKLLNYISSEKKVRLGRFYKFEDAQRSLLGDLLARYAICQRLGLKNNDLAFGLNDYGKPGLLVPTGIDFNIAHSGSWVVCAVNDKPVGIDVEVMKPIDIHNAKSYFSQEEYNTLINQPPEMRMKYFYSLWTLKESYIKAEGKGFSIPFDSFTIQIHNNTISLSTGYGSKDYNLLLHNVDSTTICATCSVDKHLQKKIYNLEQFVEEVCNWL